MNLRAKMNGKRGVLLKNTMMLYILQFSTYFFGFIVVPYETRVLGPVLYGMVGAAMAAMIYFQNVIDFGFILSGTADVALHREDKKYLSHLFTAVVWGKVLLAAVCAVVLAVLCQLIAVWGDYAGFYFLYFISIFLGSLMPDYLYRGLEQMEIITVRAVCIKAFFTVMIFVFLRDETQYWLIPLLNIIGNGVAFFGVYLHLKRKMGIGFCRVTLREVFSTLRDSLPFFYSRIATTVYTATNTIVLNIISGTGAVTGYYTSADKLITTAKSGMSPISDSMYPYMVKNRDFRLIRKSLMLLMPLILVGCVVVGIFARPLCSWFFGPEFADAAHVLRVMLPVVVVILPSYILGFPTLSPMGLAKHANYSTIVGSVFYLVVMVILFATNHVSMVTLGLLTSATEVLIFLYRLVVVWHYRDRMRPDNREEGEAT
ncbi:MAG: oligosaccharide flippase family protein [Clostridiales bacterium]|nr:oligosaccharide flippase family protein [Clostridiales bacterium]